MEFLEREVTLKLKSRPLRCVYLVRNREELLDAIALYTHIWGGTANAILPMPENEEEIESFSNTLEDINADYIFVPRENLPSQISKLLEELPIIVRPISKIEIEQYINDIKKGQLNLLSGFLPHIRLILSAVHQNFLKKSDIYLVDEGEHFSLEIALHLGLPSQLYREYLLNYLGANTFPHPANIEQLLKISLVVTKLFNTFDATLVTNTKSWNFLDDYLTRTNDEETLCLFLDNGQDIGIATAFWNCRWIFPKNKIFLPKKEFLKEIKTYALQILQFMPYIRAIYVMTPCNEEEALELHKCLNNAFVDAGREILVKIVYEGFRFDRAMGTLYSGEITNFTRTITSENSVRFNLHTPIGLEKGKFAIGYDAEVRFKSGKYFFSPNTLTGSHLLTNELRRLEYFEQNRDSYGDYRKLRILRYGFPVRARARGISGVASTGKECSFYIHPDNVVITQHLKDVGLELKSNQHTRYAKGLVKRLGGLNKVLNLFNNGGFEIMSALASRRTEARGIYEEGIRDFLCKQYNFSSTDANYLINQKLKPLLASGLIRRGYSLKCTHCDLPNWYLLEEIREILECRGCAENFQLRLCGIKFAYELNELANKLIQEGGLAVLKTAALLKRIPNSSFNLIQFGGDLFPIGSKVNTNEVDLFLMTENAFIIAECKSFHNLKSERDKQELEKRIKKIETSLAKNIDLAKRIDVKVVVLGIATNLEISEISKLFDIVAELAQTAKKQGIAVHLALNEKIYLMGRKNGFEPREIDYIDDLLIKKETTLNEYCVGESPSQYGGAIGINGLFDEEVLKQWISELKKDKQSRPFGLAEGEFTVPDDFDAPLPEDILSAFEGE